MTVIYYETNGKITNFHRIKDMPRQELEHEVRIFNENSAPKGRAAHIFDAPDGSFEAYLVEAYERKLAFTKESVQAAKDAIDQARDMIVALEPVKD